MPMENPQIALHRARIAEFEEAERKALEAQNQATVPPLEPVEEVPVPVATPVETAPVETTANPEVKDIEYWKAEAERNAKRRKDGERGLHEALAAKSHLSQELEATKQKVDEVSSLKAELEAIKSLLISKAEPTRTTAVSDFSLDPEFEETYPDIAQSIKKATASVKSEYEKRLEDINRKFEEDRKRVEEQEAKAFEARHFAEVKRLHPDAEDFIGEKYGPALMQWIQTKPPVFAQVVSNPLNFTPQDVASIIAEFKKETGFNTASPKPASGDIGFKAGKTQAIAQPSTIQPLSNDEIRNFNTLFHNARFNEPARKLLLERLEMTEKLANH